MENALLLPLLLLFLMKFPTSTSYASGMLIEVGPAFPKNSSEGVLLYESSLLQEWTILGTARYIDSTYYNVPLGKAAVQLLSGNPSSGIQAHPILKSGSTYSMNFTMGDANDSCVGDFVVYLQVGNDVVQNFSMRSNGTGSAFRHSVTFKAVPPASILHGTSVTLYTLNVTRRSDGTICGPVLDDIVLVGLDSESSYANRERLHDGVLSFSLFLAFVIAVVIF